MKKVLLIVGLLCVVHSVTMAQTLTNRERRRIKTEVLNTIEQYESTFTIHSESAKYRFLELFDNVRSRIYCDLMDYYSEDGKIEVDTYVELLSQKQLVESEVRNLVCSAPEWRDGGWHVKASFQKQMNYRDEHDVWFSTEEYFGNAHAIDMDLVYDPDERRCFITSIDGSLETIKPRLPQRFKVVQYASERDLEVMTDTARLHFNDFGQAFAGTGKLKARNVDLRIKYDTLAKASNYDKVKLKYNKTPWRARLRYGYALDGVYEISSPVQFSEQTSTAYEMGLDLGITFGKRTKFAIYSGIALQESELTFGLDRFQYAYMVSSQSMNDDLLTGGAKHEKTRQYNIAVSEGVKYSNLVVPVLLGFEHCWGRGFHFTWNVGAKFYFSKEIQYMPFHVTGSIVQQQTNTSTEQIKIDRDFTDFLVPSSYVPENVISLYGTAGFNINLVRQIVLLNLRVGCEYGMDNIHTSNENEMYKKNSGSQGIYPLIYSERVGDDVAVRSFMDCVSFKRQSLWLEAGLMFKF